MMSKAPKYTRQQIHLAQAITTVEHALQNVGKYSEALRQSPLNEMSSLMNALNGGFTAPSPGGDLIVNPNTLPTGRNFGGCLGEGEGTLRQYHQDVLRAT